MDNLGEILTTKKREQTANRIIDALLDSHGLLSMAAPKAGVSYRTINRYAHDFPAIQTAIQQAKESMLDFAESKLFQKIKEGDSTAILFYLKTQGKARGYIERSEVTGANGGPVQVENVREKLATRITRIVEAKTANDSSEGA